jgi:hypothetical protein
MCCCKMDLGPANRGWSFPPFRTVNEPIGALAHLGLARAYVLQGDTTKARAAYEDFLALWKDADTDVPISSRPKRSTQSCNERWGSVHLQHSAGAKMTGARETVSRCAGGFLACYLLADKTFNSELSLLPVGFTARVFYAHLYRASTLPALRKLLSRACFRISIALEEGT